MESPDPEVLIASARKLADDVLFPNALEADAADGVPVMQLQHLADAGFYALTAHYDPAPIIPVVEALASGCMTTAFVYAQHLGACAAAHASDGPAKVELAEAMAAGDKRGGVAFAHMLRPGTPLTTAVPVDGGWEFTGTAPWVTGWGHIDVVHAAARHGDDIVWGLIDAVDSSTLVSSEVDFAVVNATQTKVLTYDRHFVPEGRITAVQNFDKWFAGYRLGLRNNGSFALGVANRCCRLLDEPAMTARLDATRSTLLAIDPADHNAMSAARAETSLFAMKAATALVARTGGNAVMLSDHAQRLMREAMFTMVQGQNPAIKAEMMSRLAG